MHNLQIPNYFYIKTIIQIKVRLNIHFFSVVFWLDHIKHGKKRYCFIENKDL